MTEKQESIQRKIDAKRERLPHLRAAQAAIECAIMDCENEIRELTEDYVEAVHEEARGEGAG